MGAFSKLIDQVLPFFVGHRTQIIGAVNLVLVLLQQAGVHIPVELTTGIQSVSLPLGALTLAAKIERVAAATQAAIPQVQPTPPPQVAKVP